MAIGFSFILFFFLFFFFLFFVFLRSSVLVFFCSCVGVEMMRVGFAWEKRFDLLRHARETSKREAIEPNTMSIHYCVVCVFWLCTYLVRLRRRKNECSQPASEAVAAVEAVEAVALLARSLRLTPAAAVRSFQIVLCIIIMRSSQSGQACQAYAGTRGLSFPHSLCGGRAPVLPACCLSIFLGVYEPAVVVAHD